MNNPYAPQPPAATFATLSPEGYLLGHAPEEYRRQVSRGLSFILNGILLMIIVGTLSVGSNLAFPGHPTLQITFLALQLAVSLLMIAGYWLYSAADPGLAAIGRLHAARQWVRIAIVVQTVLQAVQIGLMLAFPATLMTPNQPPTFTIELGVLVLLSLFSLLVTAGQFAAMMLYTRELGARVPDPYIVKRTMIYLWLLPVLATVGILACGLGPLAALVLYWNLLDRLRKHVKSINTTGVPAALPGMVSSPVVQ